ncbi:ADP-ribosylation factor GTPase-activating protein AGD5-like [Primulina huaijiensis]|uniref:ADP-ribosylation factor GTPase-activating protein AGD5-like n=1 Tax=Primulina huaijiensis TaxID=1492673 RepID=UPI003CC6F46A
MVKKAVIFSIVGVAVYASCVQGRENAACVIDKAGLFLVVSYEEKRWISKDGKPKSPPRRIEEKTSVQQQRPSERSGYGHLSHSGLLADKRKHVPAPVTKENIAAPRTPKGSEQIAPSHVTEQVIQKTEPSEPTKHVAETVSPPKVDYATDLFNMLSLDGSVENSAMVSADDNTWAGFQSAASSSTTEKTSQTKLVDNKTQSPSGIEDLFTGSPSIIPGLVPGKPQKDAKTDIMSLFDQVCFVLENFISRPLPPRLCALLNFFPVLFK